MDKNKKKDISKSVMEKIRKGEVKMRPHLYFVFGSLLLGLGLAVAFILAAFFVNLSLFNIRAHTPFEYLRFGRPGWRPFIFNLPWLPLVFCFSSIAVGIWLIRRYDFSYKKGLFAIATGVVLAALSLGVAFNFLGVNERVSRFKPLEPLYRQRLVGEDWVVGEIISLDENEMTISTDSGDEVTVSWDSQTRLPFGADFEVGETIRAVGRWESDTNFIAKGIGGVSLRKQGLPQKPLLPQNRQDLTYPRRFFAR